MNFVLRTCKWYHFQTKIRAKRGVIVFLKSFCLYMVVMICHIKVLTAWTKYIFDGKMCEQKRGIKQIWKSKDLVCILFQHTEGYSPFLEQWFQNAKLNFGKLVLFGQVGENRQNWKKGGDFPLFPSLDLGLLFNILIFSYQNFYFNTIKEWKHLKTKDL